MSTFVGSIEEIPGISVDRFDGGNLLSSAYFLSHCHTDHMIGLEGPFFQMLESERKHLYCSSISKILLNSVHGFKTDRVKEMCTNEPTYIEYDSGEFGGKRTVRVTCVPAGHCLGSVMFLFETNHLSVLYTGDFRLNSQDLPKLKPLHYTESPALLPKKFQKIYLDTTFLSREFSQFPSREESYLKISEVSLEWLHKDPRNVVTLECSARYGAERLLIELSRLLKLKIHVKDQVYRALCSIDQLSSYITNDPYSTPIHACGSKRVRARLNCRIGVQETNVLVIVPSAMRWRGKDTGIIGEWDPSHERTFNVCYSTHSSLNELVAFARYFNPVDIFPCVCNESNKEEVYALLAEIQRGSRGDRLGCAHYQLTLPKQNLIGSSGKSSFKSEYFSDDGDSS